MEISSFLYVFHSLKNNNNHISDQNSVKNSLLVYEIIHLTTCICVCVRVCSEDVSKWMLFVKRLQCLILLHIDKQSQLDILLLSIAMFYYWMTQTARITLENGFLYFYYRHKEHLKNGHLPACAYVCLFIKKINMINCNIFCLKFFHVEDQWIYKKNTQALISACFVWYF